jgi:diacylglycerol kinase (ATP)
VRTLRDAGSQVELFATPAPNQAGRLAVEAAERGCDIVLAAGGDGTINEAVNGLAGSNIVFGVLPAGTANVLANEIGLAQRPDFAARQILRAVPVRISLGAVETEGAPPRYFALMAGIGLDARIVYELDPRMKRRFGKLAYWQGGFGMVGQKQPRFRACINGEAHRVSFALITRVRNYGGDFEIARRVRLTDRDFEVVVFEDNEWYDYLRFFGGVATNRLEKISGVRIARATQVEATAPEDQRIYIQVDGEAVGVLPATVRVVPDALTLLLPKRYAGLEE